jgi:hypothetical protein
MNWADVSTGIGPGGADEDDKPPSFLSMVRLVALSVAVTILVFFAIGYLFGRLFL